MINIKFFRKELEKQAFNVAPLLKLTPKRVIIASGVAALSSIPIFPKYEPKNTASTKEKRRFTNIKKLIKEHGVYAGTNTKRVVIPKEKLSKKTIEDLGFKKSIIAVPESGQNQFTSYRNPDNNYHIHSHSGAWTVHKDKYPSTQMLSLKARTLAGKLKASIMGLPHLIGEGVPGLAIYGGSVGKHIDTASNVIKENTKDVMRNIKRWRDDI